MGTTQTFFLPPAPLLPPTSNTLCPPPHCVLVTWADWEPLVLQRDTGMGTQIRALVPTHMPRMGWYHVFGGDTGTSAGHGQVPPWQVGRVRVDVAPTRARTDRSSATTAD